MINTYDTRIEVPPFDLPVILAFNGVLWAVIVTIAALVW